MFKTELHLHTSPVSACAHVTPEDAVEQYIENGYSTVVITNHLSPSGPAAFKRMLAGEGEYPAAAAAFIDDYHRAQKQARGRINVLLGMELRVYRNMNDYLLYGMDEQTVYDMGNVMDKRMEELYPYFHGRGILVFQAHPFRNNMTVTNPSFLDGIEAENFSPGHDSRNDIAAVWAKKFDLLTSYGTDYHKAHYMRGAGILTDYPITDNEILVKTLKDKSFTVTDGEKEYEPY